MEYKGQKMPIEFEEKLLQRLNEGLDKRHPEYIFPHSVKRVLEAAHEAWQSMQPTVKYALRYRKEKKYLRGGESFCMPFYYVPIEKGIVLRNSVKEAWEWSRSSEEHVVEILIYPDGRMEEGKTFGRYDNVCE